MLPLELAPEPYHINYGFERRNQHPQYLEVALTLPPGPYKRSVERSCPVMIHIESLWLSGRHTSQHHKY